MPAGRPLKYETEEQLQAGIDEYFAKCVVDERPPTISGLAYHLDISTECLRNYGTQEKYSATVKKAKQLVEIHLEQRLDDAAPAGAIFNLKNNFGWKDQKDLNATVNVRDVSDMTDSELEAFLTEKPT